MSKRQKLDIGPMRYLWARVHLWLGHKVIWIEDFEGDLRLTISYGTHAYVYNFHKIGRMKLNKDHTVGGSYVKYWKPYKPGVRYKRPRAPRATTSVLTLNPFRSSATGFTYQDMQNAFKAITVSSGTTAPKKETEEEKVARINKEMMDKSRPTKLTGASVSSWSGRSTHY